jgi:tRNA (guanine-N7-)-methyltransferase
LRTFGRVKGRALKPSQERLFETLLPQVAFDPAAPTPSVVGACILEIGFGGGEHLIAQAARDPTIHFIGVEPFVNGVGACLRQLNESGAKNVRIHHGDARDVIAVLPDARLDRLYILFPDPWPKTRHHKRRLIQPDFIDSLARVLKPDGAVRFATDWADYADWTLQCFLAHPKFEWSAERADDWCRPWSDHVTTRYEEKKLGDCAPIFLEFRMC